MHLISSHPPAYPSVPPQRLTRRYSDADALIRGTLFPELDLPFADFENTTPLPQTPQAELMQTDFVLHELKLYLNIHPSDTNAQALFHEYKERSAAMKKEMPEPETWPWEVN